MHHHTPDWGLPGGACAAAEGISKSSHLGLRVQGQFLYLVATIYKFGYE